MERDYHLPEEPPEPFPVTDEKWVTEQWNMGDGTMQTIEHHFKFNADGTLRHHEKTSSMIYEPPDDGHHGGTQSASSGELRPVLQTRIVAASCSDGSEHIFHDFSPPHPPVGREALEVVREAPEVSVVAVFPHKRTLSPRRAGQRREGENLMEPDWIQITPREGERFRYQHARDPRLELVDRKPSCGIVQLRSEDGPYYWDSFNMVTFWSWDGDRTYVGEYTDRPGLASDDRRHDQLLMEAVADRESRLRHSARINEMMRPIAIQVRLGDFYRARKIQRCWWKYILRKGFRPFRAAMLEEARELLSWEERTKDNVFPRELRKWVQAARIRNRICATRIQRAFRARSWWCPTCKEVISYDHRYSICHSCGFAFHQARDSPLQTGCGRTTKHGETHCVVCHTQGAPPNDQTSASSESMHFPEEVWSYANQRHLEIDGVWPYANQDIFDADGVAVSAGFHGTPQESYKNARKMQVAWKDHPCPGCKVHPCRSWKVTPRRADRWVESNPWDQWARWPQYAGCNY